MTFARPSSTARLLDILSWARPHGSAQVEQFCALFLDRIPAMRRDGFGNRILAIGDAPTVLWSCHVDTVHAKGGRQNVQWDGDTLRLAKGKPGQSLGADDGAGLWLMLEMIDAQRPGLYVFHQGEEVGCLGSKWIARNTPELLDGIGAAIALDRAGTRDVITHQMGRRICSEAYGQALADALNKGSGLAFETCDGGVFTDTEVYGDLVSECVNVSVGYQGQHGPRESLDVAFLLVLRDALLGLDMALLVPSRDPAAMDFDDYPGSPYGGRGMGRVCSTGDDGYERWASSWRFGDDVDDDLDGDGDFSSGREMLDLVMDHPDIAVRLLRAAGVTADDLFDAALGNRQRRNSNR